MAEGNGVKSRNTDDMRQNDKEVPRGKTGMKKIDRDRRMKRGQTWGAKVNLKVIEQRKRKKRGGWGSTREKSTVSRLKREKANKGQNSTEKSIHLFISIFLPLILPSIHPSTLSVNGHVKSRFLHSAHCYVFM